MANKNNKPSYPKHTIFTVWAQIDKIQVRPQTKSFVLQTKEETH